MKMSSRGRQTWNLNLVQFFNNYETWFEINESFQSQCSNTQNGDF